VRLLRAWDGARLERRAAGQAFSDPSGPDALRLAWQFFAAVMERAPDKAV
jgi:hypothetical protein